jgi:hypothetical protein
VQEITITVDAEGEVEIQTRGFIGNSCREATKKIETLLGKTTADRSTHETIQQTREQS